MQSTWLRQKRGQSWRLGVVADITSHDEDNPRKGTIKILWYSGEVEWLSAVMLRRELKSGRTVIDTAQHPYDKLEWSHQTLPSDITTTTKITPGGTA